MAYELKDGQASLFVNDYHKSGDNKPTHKGKMNLGGTLYEIAAWEKPGKDGKQPWLSLQVKPAQQAAAQAAPEPAPSPNPQNMAKSNVGGRFADMPDDIPFNSIARGISGHAI